MSTILSPLYKLLQTMRSLKEQDDAFVRAKSFLQSLNLLVHYDISIYSDHNAINAMR